MESADPAASPPDVPAALLPAEHASGVSVGVPAMHEPPTSHCDGMDAQNFSTGGVVTASDPGDRPNEGPEAAFDDHTGTKWSQSKNPTPWIVYELARGEAHAVTQYALSAAPEGAVGSDPVSWKLEGSNGDLATGPWTTLHTQERHRFVSRQAMIWYSFDNGTAYRRYRLVVTENGGGAGVELAELQLFGSGSPPFSVDDATRGRDLHQFHYSRGWEGHGLRDTVFSPPKYGLSSSWNEHTSEIVSFPFLGSQIHVYGVRHPQHGIAALSVDGGPETLADFYGEPSGNVLFYSSPPACPPKNQVLRIRTTGQKHAKSTGTYISIDRVRVVP